jgi:ketosteroid isomerase-like protein
VRSGRHGFFRGPAFADVAAVKDVRIEGHSDIRELRVLGDWAFCRTHLTATSTPREGKPMRRSGYTLTIFRKKPNGAWVVARDANRLTPE